MSEHLAVFKASLKTIGMNDQFGDLDLNPINRALALAAFCGPFDMHRLVSFAPKSIRPILAKELIDQTESFTVNGRRRRLLSIALRRQILAATLSRPALLHTLLSTVPPAHDDAQGRTLRKLINGWRPELSRLSTERLGVLSIVLGWLQGLETPRNAEGTIGSPWPQVSQIQQEQVRRARKIEIHNLLAGGMVGRESESRALLAFADKPGNADQIMIVTGAGGVGKSTLVARLANTLTNRKQPTPVLNFDFDRPALDPMGPGLTLELTRQLARFLPKSADALAQVRTVVRESFESRGGQSEHKQSSEASSVSSSSEAAYLIGQEIIGTQLSQQPIVVLLDSFEAAATRGDEAVSAIRNWLATLSNQIGMYGVRTIIVGRAAESAANLLGVNESAVFELGPLSPENALRLLRQSGLDEKRSTLVASSQDGNPLILRLLSRYLQENPQIAGNALLDEDEINQPLSQGVLYRRILNRIGNGKNDPLRKLAYPGLALRVITPGLLRDVLSPIVLNDKHQDATQTTELFQRLAQQVWLVDKESERCVRHRRDLRAITLRLLRNDPEMASQVNQLHEKAVEYYTHTNDPDLPAGRARLEQVYHRLMLLAPGEDLPTSERSLIQVAMAGEIDELPAHAAALVRLHTGLRTTPNDLQFLPATYRRQAIAEIAWAAIDKGRPEDALALYHPQRPVPVWHLTALHDTVEWDVPLNHLALNNRPTSDTALDTQRRESLDEAIAVTAFLHLWRNEFDKIASPTDELSWRKRNSRTGTARLRAAAAWGIAALLESRFEHPGWQAIREMLGPEFLFPPKDALVANAEARLWLLLWSAGHLKPGDRIPILASSLAPTPELSYKLSRLRGGPGIGQELHSLLKINPTDRVAVLTGRFARNIEKVINEHQLNRQSDLEAAGLSPRDFLPGLMTELQPATRRLLLLAITNKTTRKRLIPYLSKYMGSSFYNFTPYDLKSARWLKTASEGNGMGAILPLLEWCGRLGNTSTLCRITSKLADPDIQQSLRDLAQAWHLLETACARRTNPWRTH
ncbi:AAA family ATPase [Pseudomonas tritici]|uniref:AAA family ATPase n=1 Tax=Pseudomonas tritici TaxID=2745518 RepID=UPI00387AB461